MGCLWELVRADIAEAKLIEMAVIQLVKFIHHVVVPPFKTAVNPSCFQYDQLECTLQEMPALPVRYRYKSVKAYRRYDGTAIELHRNRPSRQIVGAFVSAELHVKRADGLLWVIGAINVINGVYVRCRVRAIAQVYGAQVEVVRWSFS
jgi:hypothetical protein